MGETREARRIAWLEAHRELWQDIPAISYDLWTEADKEGLDDLIAAMRADHVLAQIRDVATQVLRAIRHLRDDAIPTPYVSDSPWPKYKRR